MSRDAPQPPDPSVWQAQYLRLISFPVDPQYSRQQNWWQELTGSERESRVEKKRELQEEGLFEGSVLSLSIDLLRLQWTAAPRIIAEELSDFPKLGPFLERKEWFTGVMRRWLAMSPPIKRLAFAAAIVQPVETREAGYELLNRYLRCVDVDPQSTDFMYRVNRRVRSRTNVSDLAINRLTTWSVGKFGVAIGKQLVGQEIGQQVVSSESFACLLELDINTVPEPPDRELPRDALIPIFDELVDLGTATARAGDVRS